MKNSKKYNTDKSLAKAYILSHTLHTVETDDLYQDILGFLKWLREEAPNTDRLKVCPICDKEITLTEKQQLESLGYLIQCPHCRTLTKKRYWKDLT